MYCGPDGHRASRAGWDCASNRRRYCTLDGHLLPSGRWNGASNHPSCWCRMPPGPTAVRLSATSKFETCCKRVTHLLASGPARWASKLETCWEQVSEPLRRTPARNVVACGPAPGITTKRLVVQRPHFFLLGERPGSAKPEMSSASGQASSPTTNGPVVERPGISSLPARPGSTKPGKSSATARPGGVTTNGPVVRNAESLRPCEELRR